MKIFHVPMTQNGKVTLPKELRDALGVSEGGFLDIELATNGILLKRASK